MIAFKEFERAVKNKLNRNIENNKQQKEAIESVQDESFFIVAGPGSGKTTVMVLKVLKLIFVDDVDPSNILITTFTKKAASELRSRILGWGDILQKNFIKTSSDEIIDKLKLIDLNRIKTGTLDSITEEILTEYREPGTPLPAVIEDFVSKALFLKVGLFNHGRYLDPNLKNALGFIQGNKRGLNVPGMTDKIIEIKERLYHDQIDFYKLKEAKIEGIDILCSSIEDYCQELNNRYLHDFASLEQQFLQKLEEGKLEAFLKDIKFILVDEYQDSNLLQEQIYFQFAKAAIKNGGSLTVVGDDDQSLYRFRGATVSLFQKFEFRMKYNLGIKPKKLFLVPNYRSTKNIVDLCNNFITLDSKFQVARVKDKPLITNKRSKPNINYPILGMFRDNKEELAADLSEFIYTIVHGEGVSLKNGLNIKINHYGGTSADLAVLCSSPQELNYNGEPRLPLLLRDNLSNYPKPISIFNPRGQSLNKIKDIQILCGLLLECIDPNCEAQDNINNLPRFTKEILDDWRKKAQDYVISDQIPKIPDIKPFLDAWKTQKPLGRKKWEKNVSLISVIYKLITWIPNMQSDIEGLVYLEAISRTISQAALFSTFNSEIVYDPSNEELKIASIKETIRNIFIPLATGAIDINEELLETLPSDRLNIMSIHQSKGLEFPLVIVDVGSDFKSLHTPPIKRFPKYGGHTCNLEDNLRKYCSLGNSTRDSRDRAFDDLIRLYFVAFSRAQDVLLLVGLNSVKDGYQTKSGHRNIPNVATGWDRDENWIWKKGLINLVHI
jgi:DNA helicase-2/ATP-dependent DNA helicase PcrA